MLVALAAPLTFLMTTPARADAPPTMVEYPVPTPNSGPQDLVAGPDGNVWFTESYANKIGRITPAGITTEFPVTIGGQPQAITTGPDGNLWFTQDGSCQQGYYVGRITVLGLITEFPTPATSGCGGSWPRDITTGPDGNLWFPESDGHMARMTTSGVRTEYLAVGPGGAAGITTGPDGALWYTNLNSDRNGQCLIGRITTTGAGSTFGGLSYNCVPWNLVTGPDGNLWITEYASNQLARMTPSGTVTQYNVALNSGPFDVTTGPDGRIWFTEITGNSIGRMTTDGFLQEWSIPTPSGEPRGMALGPDGNVWFTESSANKIAFVRLDTTSVPQATPVGALAFAGVCGVGLMGAQLRRRRRFRTAVDLS